MAVWNTKYINDLPDSSFAYIAAGGQKDDDGKTTPRDLRKLPYKDANGDIDPAHTRNALARLDQTDGIPAGDKADVEKTLKNALTSANGKSSNDITGDMFKIEKVQLDDQGNVPNRIPILQTGNWPNSVKGDFAISVDDLRQIKDNFDNGIGFPTEDSSTGLAIDFMHNYDEEAAGWVKGLELQVDPNDATKATLFANPVEWTDAGVKAVQGGQFKCISPSGYFGSKNGKQMSMWSNPNDLKQKIANVLDGAGLTNIPFLRGMSPIRASAIDDNDSAYGNVIYVVEDQHKKEQTMQLDSLRVKERDDLTVPELDFLTENKSELSADEQKKFKLDGEDENHAEEISDEDRATLDAIKSGEKKVVDKDTEPVEKSRLDALEATAEQYREEKAQEVVNLHVSRGAIKQDAADNWKKRLLAATVQEDRDALEADLAALPDNDILKEELGSGDDSAAGATAREQLHAIANQKIAAAAKDGKEVLYADALKEANREHPELQKQDLAEQGVK